MKTDLFDYKLPPELIAQTPIEPRDQARLMVVNRIDGSIRHHYFYDLPTLLTENDYLVINDTKVVKARIFGVKQGTKAKVECFLLKEESADVWQALVRPAKRLNDGDVIEFYDDKDVIAVAEVVSRGDYGQRALRFESSYEVRPLLDKIGHIPLPPYIKTEMIALDRYQTIYADKGTSTAAPTAGLHFTDRVFSGLNTRGVGISKIRLDIGLDTFRPISTEDIEDHDIHSESMSVTPESSAEINTAIAAGKRIIAVGTTVVRTLESCAARSDSLWMLEEKSGPTGLFITPGYDFKIVKAMITNFHLPRTTLMILVSAFAGRDLIMEAYDVAIKSKYRFFSFGDTMMII